MAGSIASGARLFACAALLIAAGPPGRSRISYVIDGDTFRLSSGERIRIAGIDAPETHAVHTKCAEEIALGAAATAKVRALLDRQRVHIVRVGRTYNRTVAHVRLGGRDVAGELVGIGAARWWPRGKPKPDWCARR